MATQNGNSAGGQSVTSHPMFPALLALWFGALFGLGSLAIRPGLLEQLVLDFGIDTIVAAAAPPLGTTFRILLALAMTGFGAILGALIARRMRHTPRPAPAVAPRRARDAHPDAPPRRPISAREEFGEEEPVEIDSRPQPISGRRRALAMSEDNRPSDFHEYAPLPGAPPAYGFDAAARLDALVEKLGPDGDRVADAPVEPTVDVEDELLGAPIAGGAFAPPHDGPREGNEDLPFGRPQEVPEPPFAEPIAELVLESEPEPEPVVARESEPAQEFAASRAFAAPAESAPAGPEHERPPVPSSAAERLVGRPLEHLSTAELSERLAIALDQRRQRQAAAVAAREAAALAATATPEPEPVPVPAFAAAAMPAALRPLDLAFEDEVAEDDAPLAQRRFGLATTQASPVPHEPAAPSPAATTAESRGDESLDAETLADGYSSLLDLSRPAPLRETFVRIEDDGDDGDAIEPMVTFPGQAARSAAAVVPDARSEAKHAFRPEQAQAEPAMRRFDAPAGGTPAAPSALGSVSALDREEADRALRAALATLQRMSGAA